MVLDGVTTNGTGWSYSEDTGRLILSNVGMGYTLSGTLTDGTVSVVIPPNGPTNVTLKNLTLTTAVMERGMSDDYSVFVVSNACTMTLLGVNEVACQSVANKTRYSAGIAVAPSASLTITGNGSLTTHGGYYAAGIGSVGGYDSPGRITIESGTVNATGGYYAAGIGGGYNSNLVTSNIIVKGGVVNAHGGYDATGIGAGYIYGQRPVPDGAVVLVGGTVVASGPTNNTIVVSDLVQGKNASDSTKPCVITGGSVLGKRRNVKPRPVDADGTELYAVVVSNLTAGALVNVTCPGMPEAYSKDNIFADDAGCICLWLAPTNHERVLVANGQYYTTPYPYQTNTNGTSQVYKADVDAIFVGDPPEGLDIDGETRYRVTVPNLPSNTLVAVEGNTPAKYLVGVQSTDADGNLYIYLPDGEYGFMVNDRYFTAVVDGAETTAVCGTIGFSVNGNDLSSSGTGWTYDGTTGELTFTQNGNYVLAGTATAWRVSAVVATNVTAKISTAAPVFLNGEVGGNGSFVFAGGTLSARGHVGSAVCVNGGSLDVALSSATNTAGPCCRVTVGGLETNAMVVVDGVSIQYSGYQTTNIFSDAKGEIHLWLNGGRNCFTVNGETYRVDAVEGETATAEKWKAGVTVNGTDVAFGMGEGWTYNPSGVVTLHDGTRGFTITGTNVAGDVSVVVSAAASVTLSDICLEATNAAAYSVFCIACSTALDMCGTNSLRSGEGNAGLLLTQDASATIDGDVLETFGGAGGAGIQGGTLTINGGTIQAQGGEGGAGIQGGTLTINGGTIQAMGGEGGAGIFADSVKIYRGRIRAVGGEDAVGLGCSVTVYGGTVYAQGGGITADLGAAEGDAARTTILGGSVLPAMGRMYPAVSNASEQVYCVTIPDCTPNQPVTLEGLGEYGTDGIVADADGNVYVWLTNGVHTISVDGRAYIADVYDGDETAEPFYPIGVMVDGIDISFRRGSGWSYGNGLLMLSGNCTVSGTNVEGEVTIMLYPDLETLTVSNLVLRGGGVRGYTPFVSSSTNSCAVVLSGENEFVAGAEAAALTVHAGFSVRLLGDGSLAARGGRGGAGIGGDGDSQQSGFIQVAGGTIFAAGGGAVDIGTVGDGTYGNGEEESVLRGTVVFTGGSISVPREISPAPSNGTERVWRVTVPNLTPNAAVSLNGPPGYGTEGIRADGDGKVYLWLPDGRYSFRAGGKRMRALVDGVGTVAVLVPLPDGLAITRFAMTPATVEITVAADPANWMADWMAGWMEFCSEELRVRAGTALPLPAGESAFLDESQVTPMLNADGTVTLSFPRSSSLLMFYRIEWR